MPKIIWRVPGEPQGKARPRHGVIYDKGGNPVTKAGRVITRTYTPKKTADYEKLIRMNFLEAAGRVLNLTCGIHVGVIAYFRIAKSDTKQRRADKIAQVIPVTKSPDVDNILKAVKDALNGVAYKDDSQVVSVRCKKVWSEDPRIVCALQWEE